jgi:pimeloyl-ACP methyl ester carboxylesterase
MTKMNFPGEEKYIDVGGLKIRYLTLGNVDPPLVLIHGIGESAADWLWVISDLAERQQVIAIDLLGNGYSDKPKSDYSLEFLTQFLADFFQKLGIKRAVLVGNSLGGLASLNFTLHHSSQVVALVLVDSSGLGQRVCVPMCSLSFSVYGDLAINWSKTPLGIIQRVWSRAALLFNHPSQVPSEWIEEQENLTKIPGFLENTLAVLRSQVSIFGQRRILLDSLPKLEIPTLVIWGKAEHHTRDMLVGDAAKVLDLLERISPPLVDNLMLAIGFQLQRSPEAKSEDAPNNFDQPIPEEQRVEGDYKQLVIPSLTDILDKNPLLQWGAIAATAALALLAVQTIRNK